MRIFHEVLHMVPWVEKKTAVRGNPGLNQPVMGVLDAVDVIANLSPGP